MANTRPDNRTMTELPPDVSHRLPLIKHVLGTAIDHARLPEPFCSQAILELHDAVELFVQFIAEHVDVTLSKKADFLEYWPALTKQLDCAFPQQQTMKRLNQARVGLKHSGIRPSRDEVDELSQKTVGFLEEASRLVFHVAFSELSSIRLVGYEPAQSRLRQAEQLAGSESFGDAADMCAVAFGELMHLFRVKSSDDWSYSPFPHLSDATRDSRISMGYGWAKQNRDLASHLKKLSQAFADIEPVLLMLALGIEYRQFARFRNVTPRIVAMADGSHFIAGEPRQTLTSRDSLFAVDFVIKAALRLREIDPQPPDSAVETPFESQSVFTIAMPGRGPATAYRVEGFLTRIGGGLEAWIRHGKRLDRIKRGGSREEIVEYLSNYKHSHIRGGGAETSRN